MRYSVLVRILCSRGKQEIRLIYSATRIQLSEGPTISIYRMDQDSRVSDLYTKNNTGDTSRLVWIGIVWGCQPISTGASRNFWWRNHGESSVVVSHHVQCQSIVVVTIASDSSPNHSNYQVIEFGFGSLAPYSLRLLQPRLLLLWQDQTCLRVPPDWETRAGRVVE